jgi:hypothetical protein
MKLALVTVLCFASAWSWAQTRLDTTYQVELTVTASSMINIFRVAKFPGTTNETSLGYGISVRGMWHPGRLLSVGVLTGTSSSRGTTSPSTVLPPTWTIGPVWRRFHAIGFVNAETQYRDWHGDSPML